MRSLESALQAAACKGVHKPDDAATLTAYQNLAARGYMTRVPRRDGVYWLITTAGRRLFTLAPPTVAG